MTSTFTTNKGLEQPGRGDYQDTWDTPVNADWAAIDNALGGTTTISVTGVGAGSIALTLAQYQPPNIVFTGVLSGSLIYYVPSGVGGVWSIYNNTSGAFTVRFATATGGGQYVAIPQGYRVQVVSDGTNIQFATTLGATSANPSALSGPTAVNGTAGTFMTSDSAPAVNQSAGYTWTGTHNFNGTVNLNKTVLVATTGTVTMNGTLNAQGGVLEAATAPSNSNNALVATTNYVDGFFAPLVSPAFSGVPTAPTAAVDTSTTQLATTAFVVRGSSLVTNGYRKMADGSIEQWGTSGNASGGVGSVTFPIPFPNACLNVVGAPYGNIGYASLGAISTSGFSFAISNASQAIWWRAVGN